jgi:hypothetical protein
MARGTKVQPIDLIEELDKVPTIKVLTEEEQKEFYINELSQLFKRNVLEGPVYTLDVLKILYREHLGASNIEE